MNEPGKSDRPVVPGKPANAQRTFWEFYENVYGAQRVEGRGLAKENGEEAVPPLAAPAKQVIRTQSRADLHSALERIRQAAQRERGQKFTSLWHHVYHVERLREAYLQMRRQAAAGVDGQTWEDYGRSLEQNLKELSQRLARGAYRAKPVRRVYIPKADGRQRPIGIPALEDKIVQRATVAVLSAVYEADFLGFSYGFRPGRGAHQALDALAEGIRTRKVNWVLDADIRGFFDTLSHEWLVKFVEHRIADRRVVRHIQKWLNAGVLEDGRHLVMEEGTPQGGSISPLLANLYLHHVLDLWAVHWRKTRAHGDVIIVRYADDFVVGFQHKADAERFQEELRERFRKFNLELHAEKTRLIEFGRFASQSRERRGEGKPKTFDFLGFTHICSKDRRGKFVVLRQTMAKRVRAKLKALYQELRRRMHWPIRAAGAWLGTVLTGHYRYYGVPRNGRRLQRFRMSVWRLWRRVLEKRSQRGRITCARMKQLAARWLPVARTVHPYPDERLRVMIRGKSPVQ